jgi:hypothetical protein
VVAKKATERMLVNMAMAMARAIEQQKERREGENEGTCLYERCCAGTAWGHYWRHLDCAILQVDCWAVSQHDPDQAMRGMATGSMAISAIELLEDYLRSYQAAGHPVAVLLR